MSAASLAHLHRSLSGSPDAKQLHTAMLALAVALLPHMLHVPGWIPLLVASAALWRFAIEIRAWRLPPKWLRIAIATSAMAAVAATFHTLNGLDAGSALLTTMAGIKLLETRGARDCTILVFIGFVLVFASLLYDQSFLRLPYVLGTAWLLIAALLRLHQAVPSTTRTALRTGGIMVLQALPVAVLLFIFFPRLPGHFWALPARDSATTGLSDEMTPGDISELTISGAIAFRVKFDGKVPPPIERYWRGPVLHDFDGRSWHRGADRIMAATNNVIETGPMYSYRLTLEPTQRNWVFALDVPTAWPESTVRTYDLQLVSRGRIATLTSYALQSHTDFRTTATLSHTTRFYDTALPGKQNPRTRTFARRLRASVTSDAAYITAVLDKFRREDYYYTLTPPKLGDDSVDEFLFDTKRGFCEHFASAFTVLMRAAGIPARVVTGYQGGEYNTLGDYFLIRQSDAHAWSEVWLDGRGWVRVDPTAAVAPQRIERNLDAAIPASESVPGRFMRTNLFWSRAELAWDAINNFWNDHVVEYNDLKQRSLMALLGIADADYRDFGVAMAATLIAFFVVLTTYLGWQYRPRRRDPIVAAYERLCRKLARAHIERAPHEGPVDYLQRAAAARPEWATQLRELRELYTELRYGPTPLASQASRFKYLVNRFGARNV